MHCCKSLAFTVAVLFLLQIKTHRQRSVRKCRSHEGKLQGTRWAGEGIGLRVGGEGWEESTGVGRGVRDTSVNTQQQQRAAQTHTPVAWLPQAPPISADKNMETENGGDFAKRDWNPKRGVNHRWGRDCVLEMRKG